MREGRNEGGREREKEGNRKREREKKIERDTREESFKCQKMHSDILKMLRHRERECLFFSSLRSELVALSQVHLVKLSGGPAVIKKIKGLAVPWAVECQEFTR